MDVRDRQTDRQANDDDLRRTARSGQLTDGRRMGLDGVARRGGASQLAARKADKPLIDVRVLD